jgi:hypothetical protein
MKKIFLFLAFVLIINSCTENDSCSPGTGVVPENNITDLTIDNISKNPLGGDPRGVYFANNPIMFVISTATDKTVIDSMVVSEGNLMYEFTGDSDTEGEFTLIEDYFNIEYYLIWKNQYGQSKVDLIQNINNDPPSKVSGKWKVNENILMMETCGQESSVLFTSTSKGLFFFKNYADMSVGNYTTIMSYKRQN